MAVYAVSFRIAERTTDQGDPDTRYRTFVEAVHSRCKEHVWEETTSFILLESDMRTAGTFAKWVNNESYFDPNEDKALFINLSEKDHAMIGYNSDQDLGMIMSAR